jgi:hypothetical protein
MRISFLIILGIIVTFLIGVDNTFAEPELTEPIITVQMYEVSTFYSTESHQIIRATVEIQNYTPSDGLYHMKVTHIPTQIILKNSEIYPKPSGNDLWAAQIAYPFLVSDIEIGDHKLFGEFEIHISKERGSQTASTSFFIYEFRYGPESREITEPETETQIDPPSLELESGPSDESTQIPEWVKANAAWWANGSITENEFLQGIEYLIENKIMKISKTKNQDLSSIINTYTLPLGSDTKYVEITGKFTEKHEGPLTLTIVKPDKIEEKLTTFSRDGTFMTTMVLTSGSSLGLYNVYAEIKGEEIPVFTFNVQSKETRVPTWIKNNADWWAQGLITDDDFVKGIQYLVEQKIIRV